MGPKMRLSILPPSLLTYVLFLINLVRCSLDVDFSAYPAQTRTCLRDAADDSGCSGDTVAEINKCLCSNTGNFVIASAACIGKLGTVVGEVYSLMEQSCSDTKTPLSISQAAFLAASNETTTVTSTITTTSAGFLTTYTTTSTSTNAGATAATSTSGPSDADDDGDSDDDDESGGITASAKIGAITSSVAGALVIACVVCLIIMIKKRRRDKIELQKAREATARDGDAGRGDKPLLDSGSMTPGVGSPAGPEGYEAAIFGASVVPPTPSHPGPAAPQVWRSWSQSLGRGTPSAPSELASQLQQYELQDGRTQGHLTQWPSPDSQGAGTVGSWCPSPLSALPSSNVPEVNGTGTSTIGPASTLLSPISRQITGPSAFVSGTRPSWAHDRPIQEEPFELPADEIMGPVEADSIPITRLPERRSMESMESMEISQAPPEYTAGGWIDPVTDKPPAMI